MSFMSNYRTALKKLQEEEGKTDSSIKAGSNNKTTNSTNNSSNKSSEGSFMDNYRKELSRLQEEEKISDKMTVGKLSGSTKEKERKLDFFQKGSFEDGYQFGDVSKAILGAAGDVGLGVVKGAAGLVEGLVDLVDYGIAGIADVAGADDYADRLRKVTQESLVDKATKGADDFLDKYSVLGRTSDAILKGVGQVGGVAATAGFGAAAGMSSAGVSALTTGMMGLSGMGSGMGEAYQGGATDEEAVIYGAISGGADALSELMFGGLGKGVNALGFSKGLSSADDILAKTVSDKFKRQITKNIAEFVVKASAEGVEEVVAGTAQAIGKKLTYMSEEDLGKILNDENLLEQFVVGAVTSGIAQAPRLHGANKTKTDFITGQTQNEQAVIKKEVENRIAEMEQDGRKLTKNEKSAIEAQVEKDLEKGYISTDTIEEVLGGETYQNYKDMIDGEDAIRQEFDTLNKMKQGEMTGEQIDRRAELKQQIESFKDNSLRDQLKSQLSEEVSEMAKSDRLIESYNERVRKTQAYEADLTKYDAKQQAVIKKAVESGILNNTNRTHEFVDMVAKISADKGVLFDFTNNERLKESGFAVNGKTVNGYVTKDGVTLNIQSAKSLNSVVGHEITHVLEGTEIYTELQSVLTEYAKAKGDYQVRYDSLAKMYEGVEGANIDNELTADLVGDYLFTDADFINNLSTNHRNVFQKIYDEIKYLCKVATAGSKEARELEKVKRAFDKAYRETGKADGDTKYSLSDSDGKQLTKEQQEYFKDSKMRDENGNLKVMYHGSQDAGFHVFDPAKSDDEISLFFVDRNDVAASYSGTSETYEAKTIRTAEDMNNFLAEIGYDQYEAVEKNGKFELLENGDHVAWSDTAQGIYEEFCWYEGVGVGDVNYKVYLNLKNPLVVDADGRNWDNVSREFSQEIADRYNSLTAEEKAALYDIAGWGEISIFRDELRKAQDGALASAYKKMGDVNIYDLFSIAEDNFSDLAIEAWAVKQMTTRDYAQRAKAEGYDGVIFKNIHDNGAYSNGSEGASTVAIAFDSNQIKSVANAKPTGDKDIRFSLSESVEETKDLVALHNLTEGKLLKSLKLGGLPMPSIAIAKAKDGHSEFGEISLVLPRETIDPKESRNNRLYSGDAWTPTYPKVDYKLNSKVLKQVEKKIESLVPYEVREFGRLHLDSDNMEDVLNRYNGDMVDAFKSNDALKYAYLKESGEDITLPMKEKNLDYYGSVSNESVRYFSGKLVDGLQTVKAYRNMSTSELLADKELAEAIADAYNWDVLRTLEPGSDEYLAYEQNPVFSSDDLSFSEIDRMLSATRKLFTSGIEQTVDTREARGLINDRVDQPAYEEWLEDLFSGIVEKEGIRNNKDYFTPSGNRRSFEALHYEHNLENVIKAMREKGEKGIGFGGGSIFGAATTEFSSVEAMKKSSDRLKQMSDEEYQEIKDGFSNRFFALARSLPKTKNSFSATDDAANVLTEAVAKYQTRRGIANYLRKELDGWATYSEQVVDDLIELVKEIRNMPTGYFEAKPQRAAGFDEVAVFIIPYDANVKLKQELLNNGYSIAEYDPKVEGDRTRVLNQFEELKFSLSNVGDTPKQYGSYNVSGEDVALAPVAENATTEESSVVGDKTEPTVAENATVPKEEMSEMFPDDLAPTQTELDRLNQEKEALEGRMLDMANSGDFAEFESVNARYTEVNGRIAELEREISESDSERVNSLTDEDVPLEMDAPYYGEPETPAMPDDPFYERDISDVGNRKVKAYMYENPEVKPFFQAEANVMLGDLANTIKGEKIYNDEVYYASGGEKGWMGTKRHTTDDIAELLDTWHYTYAEIEKGLKAIIEDNGKENNAVSKRIEFMLNDRLLNGYTGVFGDPIPANQDYINLLNEKQITEYSKEAFDSFMATADMYAPVEDIGPTPADDVTPNHVLVGKRYFRSSDGSVRFDDGPTPDTATVPLYDSKEPGAVKGKTSMFEPPKPNQKVATVLTEEVAVAKEKSGIGAKLVSALVDKGMAVENLSLKTGNMELQSKYNYALPSNTEARAQYLMENGANGVKSLKEIMDAVTKAGKEEQFSNYLYHVHNIDRMTLEDRFGVENKTVFGETVTADVSRRKVAQLERANPEFKRWANDVYAYNKHLRRLLADSGVISSSTANLWEKMYPHYVPIRRVDAKGQSISVPLDTNKTGVNNPVKRATGGNSNIQPVFATMAQRTEQTYRAIARNSFGIELKNTLGSTINAQENTASVDETIDTLVAQEDHLLKAGTQTSNPTFTVFENGERVEFEITEDLFDALKPAGKLLGYRNKAITTASDARRNLLTQWNPVFALYRNPIKDLQDLAINSQHPVKTYLNVPNAIWQMATDGKYATEYHQNGGKSNTYFDSRTNKFKTEDNAFKKAIGMPIRALETAGEFIEEIPRLAEYIASRQDGRSVERSMLDAARVTTNFAAGGDFTKFLNSHGFTFLNASVQGASQHVRNFREAKQQGLKGYVKVLAKYTAAGLPAILLNGFMWDDDEEYEELSDYVKQNYYVVAKTEDGKFVRIPKGRTAAVMQNAFEQMQNLITGDDEVDFQTFFELFMNNIAPNNPIENNILAPIGQAISNEAWYGGDLVPSRLQDLPAEEQFDESTDSISKWLGEKTGLSPYKINYLLDQYSGGLGDTFLPMITPEAESGDNSLLGNILAPWKKEITTDKELNNKNPGDFYDLKDELQVLSNSKNATEEDRMRSMYMDTISYEMSKLYAEKREWQNSGFSDSTKYEKVREIQEQINELAKSALEGYNDVHINGLYSEVGDRRYNMDAESGKWYEIREKNSDGSDNWYYQKEQEVTQALGISYDDYWNNWEEYNYAYDKPSKYAIAKAVGGYDSYMDHYDVLENWQSDRYLGADKDASGNSISGSRKAKVIDYINGLDMDYGEKIILYRTVYESKADKEAYNMEIINYLNGRDDISYQDMKYILEELGMEVDDDGNISWN